MTNTKTQKKRTSPASADNKKAEKPSFSKYVLFVLLLLLGLVIGYFVGVFTGNKSRTHKNQENQEFSEIRAGGYEFTNPLLDCDNFHSSMSENLVELKNDLNDYVNNSLKNGMAKHISVYYRSLNNGPWIGINEQSNFTPASLLKVPILISVLKKAETDTTLLSKRMLFDQILEVSSSPNLIGSESLKIGSTYTVDMLLDYMIIHSDNNAKEILMRIIGTEYLTNVMIDLGVNLTNRDLSIDFISTKEYSSFFRILYNSSYLNRDMSEKALKLLSKVKFDKGIPAKLPKNIKIAHKFGERAFTDSNIKQLHDCGIVYLPNSPYLLCIMTKGEDFDKLVTIISDISEMVYNDALGK